MGRLRIKRRKVSGVHDGSRLRATGEVEVSFCEYCGELVIEECEECLEERQICLTGQRDGGLTLDIFCPQCMATEKGWISWENWKRFKAWAGRYKSDSEEGD